MRVGNMESQTERLFREDLFGRSSRPLAREAIPTMYPRNAFYATLSHPG